jgi:hypothetical protein
MTHESAYRRPTTAQLDRARFRRKRGGYALIRSVLRSEMIIDVPFDVVGSWVPLLVVQPC